MHNYEELIERARKQAMPDPNDEREVMHAPLLRELADAIDTLVKERDELLAKVDGLERELTATQHVVAQYAEGERKLRAELVKTRLEASLDYNTLFGELQVALEELAALRKQIDELEPVAYFDDDTSTLTFNKTIPGHAWKPVYLLEGIKK